MYMYTLLPLNCTFVAAFSAWLDVKQVLNSMRISKRNWKLVQVVNHVLDNGRVGGGRRWRGAYSPMTSISRALQDSFGGKKVHDIS